MTTRVKHQTDLIVNSFKDALGTESTSMSMEELMDSTNTLAEDYANESFRRIREEGARAVRA